MPAINFRAQWANKVESGAKRQTIRAPRKDGRPTAKVGDRLYLYVGLRTKGCRKLGEGVCTYTGQVVITPERRIIVDGRPVDGAMADQFAKADGFDHESALLDFFEITHGLPFEGSLIQWFPNPSDKGTKA